MVMPFETLAPGVLIMAGLILSLLIGAEVFLHLKGRALPADQRREIRARLSTWWVIAGLFLSALILSPGLFIAFFAFVSFLALKEYLSLIPTRRADRRVLFWAYLAIPVHYYWIASGWYGMFVIFIPVYMFLFLPFRMILAGETRGFLKAAGTLHWGLMLTVYALSHLPALMVMPLAQEGFSGAGLVLFIVFLVQFNDVAQYIWGKRFGRHRIVPAISPNKTWEGFLGGMTTSLVLALGLAALLTPFNPVEAALIGIAASAVGFIGDVVVSALKRDLGVKDSGTLLPGHGGVLDRVDSLLFAAPLFYHYVRYMHGG